MWEIPRAVRGIVLMIGFQIRENILMKWSSILLLFCFDTASAQPPERENAPKTGESNTSNLLKCFQGEWAVVESSVSLQSEKGYGVAADYGGLLSFRFNEKDLYSIQRGATELVGEYEIDADRNPMRIDVGGQKGIFKLENNLLIIRWGTVRPTDFSCEAEAEEYVLRRGTHSCQEPFSAQIKRLQGSWTNTTDSVAKKSELTMTITGCSVVWRFQDDRYAGSVDVSEKADAVQLKFSDSQPFYSPRPTMLLPPVPMSGFVRFESNEELKLQLYVGESPPVSETDTRNLIAPIELRRLP